MSYWFHNCLVHSTFVVGEEYNFGPQQYNNVCGDLNTHSFVRCENTKYHILPPNLPKEEPGNFGAVLISCVGSSSTSFYGHFPCMKVIQQKTV